MAKGVKKAGSEKDLEGQGWTKRNTYDEPRLGELVAAYEEAGFDVRLVDPDENEAKECNACFAGGTGKLKTIYTRERKKGEGN